MSVTINAAYDEQRAKDYLYSSALAYCPPEDVMNDKCNAAGDSTKSAGIEPVYAFDNDNKKDPIYMSFLERKVNKEIIFAFSGSITYTQIVDEITDSLPKDYDIHDVKSAKVFDFFYKNYVEYMRNQYLSLLNEVVQDKKYKNFRIVFTGHSLGGALAIHSAADGIFEGLLDNHKISIFTYGQPRVGNKIFMDSFLGKVDEYYRLTHNKDIVAHLPPCVPNFHHGCVESGILPVYPYHGPREVFYSKDMKSHKLCSATEGEDSSCSNQVITGDLSRNKDNMNLGNIDEHKHYFGIDVGQYYHEKSETEETIKTENMVIPISA